MPTPSPFRTLIPPGFPSLSPKNPTIATPSLPSNDSIIVVPIEDEVISKASLVYKGQHDDDDNDAPSETEYKNPDDGQIPLEAHLVRSGRVRKPNRRIFGDEWTNHTVQLTPSSRTLLGHIVPNLNHDDLFSTRWIGTPLLQPNTDHSTA